MQIAQGRVGGLTAGGVEITAGEGHRGLAHGGVGHRARLAAARARAAGDGQDPREGLAVDGGPGEGDVHTAEAAGRPEGEVGDIGRGAVEVPGGRGGPGAHAAGAGAVMVEGALVEIRQGLEADVVQPLAGHALAEAGEVGQGQLHRLAGGADIGDVPGPAAGGLDVELHRSRKGEAGTAGAAEGDAHDAVEAFGGDEGHPIQLGGAILPALGSGGAPGAVPVQIEDALGGRGKGEGDGRQGLAGGVLAEVLEVPAVEAHQAAAVVVIGDGVVQALLDLDHQLAVVFDAGDAVARVADAHRAYIALGRDEGDGVQLLGGILLIRRDLGGVVPLVAVVEVEGALGGGGESEDHVAKGRAGLLVAGRAKQGRAQL